MINDIKLQSDDITEIIKARIEFNKQLLQSPIGKDDESNRGEFLSLESLQAKTNEMMIPLGLYIDQTTICENGSEYMVTTLHHISGQFLRSVGWLFKEENEMNSDLAKEFGSIMTYKQRYQWRSVLGVGRGSADAEKTDSTRTKKQYNTKQTVKSESWLSRDHQNEIFKIIKDDGDAINELCRIFKVSTFDYVLEGDFEKMKAAAIEIAKNWNI